MVGAAENDEFFPPSGSGLEKLILAAIEEIIVDRNMPAMMLPSIGHSIMPAMESESNVKDRV